MKLMFKISAAVFFIFILTGPASAVFGANYDIINVKTDCIILESHYSENNESYKSFAGYKAAVEQDDDNNDFKHKRIIQNTGRVLQNDTEKTYKEQQRTAAKSRKEAQKTAERDAKTAEKTGKLRD